MTVSAFESREAKLNSEIDAQIKQIRARSPFDLPGRNAEIVNCYVRKIEGTYNVERAKKDTDNAIDLLYIAYNTTPQEEDAIRVKISGIMNRLIKTQQDSERTMARAMRTADTVLGDLNNYLPEWLDVKEGKDMEEMKAFVKSDLLSLSNKIKAQALSIKEELTAVANAYDGIINDTVAATSTSETTLGKRLGQKAKIEEEINAANADRERLDALVTDLKAEVDKFDKMAREYGARAETAEERAFIMSIVRVGAQVVSAAIPAVAMTASGPGSILAASALGRTAAAKDDDAGASGASAGKSAGNSYKKTDNTEEVIKTKKSISEKKAALEKSEKKVADLKQKKADLKTSLEEETKKNPKKSEPSKKPESPKGAKTAKPDEDDDEANDDDSEAEKGLKERITKTKQELAKEEEVVGKLDAALAGLKASLDALDKGLGALSDKQQEEAGNLRTLQMKMLDKVEAYEKERRDQSAQLVKITALLKGKRSQEETIQLCIKSLNLSLSALKRAKEIIEEIAFFFKSFADFMQTVADEAVTQMKLLELVASKDQVRTNLLDRLLVSVDEFFIKQAGEWNATHTVSDKFNKSFAEGWSKLNKLSAKYITGDELAAYLKQASVLLESIVEERESVAKQKILALDDYRKQIRESVAA